MSAAEVADLVALRDLLFDIAGWLFGALVAVSLAGVLVDWIWPRGGRE
jgi:hypothetical protein